MLKLEEKEKLQSIGYKNIAMSDKHVNSSGDVILLVRLSIIKKEEPCHSLSSDLGCLINDEASSDLILEAGERKFRVHRNILAARSPVFASLLAQLEEEIKAKETEAALEESGKKPVTEHDKIEEETKEAVTCEETESEQTDKEASTDTKNLSPEPEELLEGESTKVELEKETSKVKSAEEEKGEREKTMKKLVIPDLPSDTVEELLRYIYTDSSNNVDLFSQTLLAASDIYQVR